MREEKTIRDILKLLENRRKTIVDNRYYRKYEYWVKDYKITITWFKSKE